MPILYNSVGLMFDSLDFFKKSMLKSLMIDSHALNNGFLFQYISIFGAMIELSNQLYIVIV